MAKLKDTTIEKATTGGQNQIAFKEAGTTKTQLTSNYGDNKFYLYHEGDNVMTIDSSSETTFSGDVNISGVIPKLKLQSSNSNDEGEIHFTNAATQNARIRHEVADSQLKEAGQGLIFEDTSGTSFHIEVNGNTYSRGFYDYDNTAYYLNPASTSELNAVNANRVVSENVTTTPDEIGNIKIARLHASTTSTAISNIDNLDSFILSKIDGSYGSGTKPSGTHNGFGVISLQTHTGNYFTQIGLDTNQNSLWTRSANGTSSYGSWQRVFADDYHPNADKWTTARTITLSGDLTGSVSLDGSSDVTLSAQVANNSHTHDDRYVELTGDTMTGTLTAPTLKLTNNAGDTSAHRVAVYDSGSTSYGMMLWNSNGTSGDWSTMIYGPNQENRRISFGKVNGSTFTSHSNVSEIAHFDLDDSTLNLTGGRINSTVGAASHNHGSISIGGSKGGYSGIAFPNANAVFMIRDSDGLSGVYKNNSTWAWYFDGSGVLTDGQVPWARLSNLPDPTITLTGDVTGSGTMTNLGNVSITTTVVNDSHTHDGRYVKKAGDTMSGALKVDFNQEYDDLAGLAPANTGQIRIDSGNNGMSIGLDDDTNTRTGWIQVGHNSNSYPSDTVTGKLLLNPHGGNVGIGKASPGYDLDVAGTARFEGPVIVETNSSTARAFYVSRTGTSQALRFYTNDSTSHIDAIQDENTGEYGSISISADMEAPSSYISLTGNTVRLNGDVGIDISTPLEKLDVDGNMFLRGSLNVNQHGDGDTGGYAQVARSSTDREYIFGGGATRNSMTDYLRLGVNKLQWTTSGNVYNVFHDGYHPNADKWTTSRTLTLTGDVTGSVSWDGSANATITTTVVDDSHDLTWANIDGETANSVNSWGGLRHQTNDGYIDFGPANSSYAHIYTDRPEFYFNKELKVLGDKVFHEGNLTFNLSGSTLTITTS